jgi:hypothetical protein
MSEVVNAASIMPWAQKNCPFPQPRMKKSLEAGEKNAPPPSITTNYENKPASKRLPDHRLISLGAI